MGLRQACFGFGQTAGTLSTTRYFAPFSSRWVLTNTTAGLATQPIDRAITVRNWHVKLTTAPGGAVSRTFTLYKNGGATALTLSITGAATSGSDTTHEVSFAAGDTAYIEMVTSAAVTDTDIRSVFEIENSTNSACIHGFGENLSVALGVSTGNQDWDALFGGGNWNASTSGIQTQNVLGVTGTITGYRITLSAAPGAGKSRKFTIYKNDVAQDGTAGTPNTVLTFNDATAALTATFTLTVAVGDRLYVQHDCVTGVAAAATALGTLSFTSDSPGESNLCSSNLDATTGSGVTEYSEAVGCGLSWTATEANRTQHGPSTALEFSGMIAALHAAPGSGKSIAITLRKNGADTGQTVTIADAATSGGPSGAAPVTITDSDTMALKYVFTGVDTNLCRIATGYTLLDPVAANEAPVADAGPDQTVDFGTVVQLAGSATDDGQPDPPAALTYAWSKVSGPGSVTFSNANIAAPTVTFGENGVYVLRLTVDDSALNDTDDVQITVNNTAPVVDAGDDQQITQNQRANLAGSATDDGMPLPAALTYTWSKISGPGTVTFEDASSATTSAAFSQIGTYVLRLTVSDGALSGFDEMSVVVGPRLMRRLRVAPHIASETNQVGIDRFRLDLEAGVGLASGQGQDPQLMLRWSNDGGQTFGNEHWQSAGRQGQYRARAQWFRLGAARDRVFELSVSDPVPYRILGAFLEVRGGKS
jgi:hypothetical protein